MSRRLTIGLLVFAVLLATGCESTGSGYSGSSVSVGYYQGSGWYDPYYGRRCCYYRPPPPPAR